MSSRIIIIGNGMAGARLAKLVGGYSTSPQDLLTFGAEPHPAYNRILLTAWLANACTAEDLNLSEANAAGCTRRQRGITHIDPINKQVTDDQGDHYTYDRLVIATGSSPIVINQPGVHLQGVTTLRTLDDTLWLKTNALPGAPAVVVGGGLLGLEAAWGLHQLGMHVTVLHRMPVLMERQLDTQASLLLTNHLRRLGIRVELEVEVTEYIGDERLTAVQLSDGRKISTCIAVISIGTKPNIALALASGLKVNRGIVVDDSLRTSDPHIFAVGECAEHRGICYGLLAPCYEQVNVCASQLCGCPALYGGSQLATRLKVSGIDLFAAGQCTLSESDDNPQGTRFIRLRDDRGVYRKLVLRNQRIQGALLLGDASGADWYQQLMTQGQDVTDQRRSLVFGPDFCHRSNSTTELDSPAAA